MCHVLDPKAITTYKEYQAALGELDELMLADPTPRRDAVSASWSRSSTPTSFRASPR
jgi:hypothetical protein